MTTKLIIPGRMMCLNDYIKLERGNKYAAAEAKAHAEIVVRLHAREQLREITFQGPVHMDYLWVEKDRRRDKDNIVFARKFIQDGLVKAGVLKGDGWKYVEGFTDRFAVDADNPRIEITFREAGE